MGLVNLCIPVDAYGALKGRPRALPTVKLCLGYPGAPPYVLEENSWSSVSLLACNRVSGQRIIGQPKKRIIRGGRLGSSATYLVHWPLHCRCAGEGDWCSSMQR